MHLRALIEKTNESLSSVIPITAIVLLLSISIAPLTPGALILFLFGAVLLVAGMGLFTLGVDMSMLPMARASAWNWPSASAWASRCWCASSSAW